MKAIEAGQVTVNFKVVKSSSTLLRPGDVVMTKGMGKLEVLDISETRRKGRVRANVRKIV